MAKNDVILIDGLIDQRLSQLIPSDRRDEVFELLALEEVLKAYDLTREEIESGWIDGRDDGGIDGFYIFINGHLLDDVEDLVWPRSNASIDVWLFTCKHHSTFLQAPLDSILVTIQELFDFSRSDAQLIGSYSDDLLAARARFYSAYRRLSLGRPSIKFNIVYTSRGDTSEIGESVVARARQIEAAIVKLFSNCTARFGFVGASELVDLHRKGKTFSLDLPFLEHLATGKDSYVLLVRLEDYWKFVSDEDGNLRRYLFDSNVRDYLGPTEVNEDIARSLGDSEAPDFWWLNNGVTILATSATIPGKTIQLQDIQVVNGLQTTETIFRHFRQGSTVSRERALLVKILVSSDEQVRDRIIRATNNQSLVGIAALHATDKIQRDIEEILERENWYYERRKNYFRNIGKPSARFVTPIYLAGAVISLLRKHPALSARLKSKFMRDQESYSHVFSPLFPIEVWPVLVRVYKQVENGMTKLPPPKRRRERFFKTWRPLISLLVVARRLKTFAYAPNDLAALSADEISDSEVAEAFRMINGAQAHFDRTKEPNQSFAQVCCSLAAEKYALAGPKEIGRWGIPKSPSVDSAQNLSAGFVERVDAMLPKQPWKPGIHVHVAEKLACTPKEVTQAIQALIAMGKRYSQRDGVVYDTDGKVIAVDEERASAAPYAETKAEPA